jgi:hypothetical protein
MKPYLVEWNPLIQFFHAHPSIDAVTEVLAMGNIGTEYEDSYWIEEIEVTAAALEVAESIAGNLGPELHERLMNFVNPLWGGSVPINELCDEGESGESLAMSVSPRTVASLAIRLSENDLQAIAKAVDGAKYDREWYFPSAITFVSYLSCWIRLFQSAQEKSMGIVVTLYPNQADGQ